MAAGMMKGCLGASLLFQVAAMRSVLNFTSEEVAGNAEEVKVDQPVRSVYESDVNAEKEIAGCYCKKVTDVSQCLDNKYPTEPMKVNGPRFFHENIQFPWAKDGSTGNLCCKADYISLFNFHGRSYKRVDDLTLCELETRPVPAEACCWLKDKEDSQFVGVKVRHAQSALRVGKMAYPVYPYNTVMRFWKSAPMITSEMIVDGVDYDGSRVDAEDVRNFVQMQLGAEKFEGLACGGERSSFDKLFATAANSQECKLRQAQTQQCCCHQASLEEATRCLPAQGSATGADAEPKFLTGNYTERVVHQEYYKEPVKEGGIRMPYVPNWDADLVEELRDVADPAAKNVENTSVNESRLQWRWIQARQWRKECVQTQRVAYANKLRKTAMVPNGVRCNKAGFIQCVTAYRTDHWTEYSQGWKEECISYKYTRLCPAGTGRFTKYIEPGSYLKEPSAAREDELALQDLGSRMFQCPDEYKSGDFGSAKYASNCRCN